MNSHKERADFRTRFQKGRSGNPSGRPKGSKNASVQINDVLFKSIRVNDGNGVRLVPKIVVAVEVCLHKAMKGDVRALMKMMDIAERFKAFRPEDQAPIGTIRRVIIDPQTLPPLERDKVLADFSSRRQGGSSPSECRAENVKPDS